MMRFGGKVAALLLLCGPAQAASVDASVRDDEGRPVADAVVVAVPEARARGARGAAGAVEQIDLEFVPHVKVVSTGSAVSFPNRDSVRHHVYSFSPAKRFDLPLYTGSPHQPVVFDKPGVVTIGCNIHDWMVGYIYVADSPYFAITGADGRATLANLPDGRYSVRVWHPRLAVAEESTRRLAPLAGQAALEWKVPLKADLRVRRAPTPGYGGRY